MDVKDSCLLVDWMKWLYHLKLDCTLILMLLLMAFHMDVLDLKPLQVLDSTKVRHTYLPNQLIIKFMILKSRLHKYLVKFAKRLWQQALEKNES